MIYFSMVFVWFLFKVMDSSISATAADFSEVVDFSTIHALLAKGQASSGWMA